MKFLAKDGTVFSTADDCIKHEKMVDATTRQMEERKQEKKKEVIDAIKHAKDLLLDYETEFGPIESRVKNCEKEMSFNHTAIRQTALAGMPNEKAEIFRILTLKGGMV